MASYLIIDTVRTACVSPQGHVTGVVLDRGGAYPVTDIYDFIDFGGHRFLVSADTAQDEATKVRCRHCGCPTLRLAADPSTRSELDERRPPGRRLPVQGGASPRVNARTAHHVDIASTG
jgi:hypothetical protein